jgi:hypothetical protein
MNLVLRAERWCRGTVSRPGLEALHFRLILCQPRRDFGCWEVVWVGDPLSIPPKAHGDEEEQLLPIFRGQLHSGSIQFLQTTHIEKLPAEGFLVNEWSGA